MSQQMRFSLVPHARVKQEVISSEDEEDVRCKVCNKAFASEVALRNHARMEHIDVFGSGTRTFVQDKTNSLKQGTSKENTKKIAKAQKMLKSIEPVDLIALAKEDVSYIIIKAEDSILTETKEKKRKGDKSDAEKPEKVFVQKRERETKEPQPITGPFECLQPSTLVADGTCHRIFFSCCEYSAHYRDEHTRRRKGLRCQVCEKPLLSSGEEPIAPYPCDVCGAGFETNKELSNHMAIEHVKLKPFECQICHKRFTQQGGVQQHMRMHTGDRPFSCTFCPKAFTQKSGLDQHLRIHTKVKPYRCVVCGKTFCQSVHLKQHMRTHTNVAPFQCGICQKRFKQSSHLNYHLKNHNQTQMTTEQKAQYGKLMSLIRAKEAADAAANAGGADRAALGVPRGYQEQDSGDSGDGEEQGVIVEQEQIEQEQMDQEQILAEQSIQVQNESGETYILSDTGNEVWSFQLVE